jgi:hypothetical protein
MNAKVEKAIKMSRAYWGNVAGGGSLHIVLEDGNLETDHVLWCKNYAKEQGDPEGVKLAEFLLTLTEDERDEVYQAIYP